MSNHARISKRSKAVIVTKAIQALFSQAVVFVVP